MEKISNWGIVVVWALGTSCGARSESEQKVNSQPDRVTPMLDEASRAKGTGDLGDTRSLASSGRVHVADATDGGIAPSDKSDATNAGSGESEQKVNSQPDGVTAVLDEVPGARGTSDAGNTESLVPIGEAVIVDGADAAVMHEDEPDATLASDQHGMTWGSGEGYPELDVIVVGCYGSPKPGGPCDAYQGDTSCDQQLPILCLNREGKPRPAYPVTQSGGSGPPEFYRGWSEGTVGLTPAISGVDIGTLANADKLCEESLGKGYRTASHDDGRWIAGMGEDDFFGSSWDTEMSSSGGWTFFAYGQVDPNTRFWVNISDQPANCWEQ